MMRERYTIRMIQRPIMRMNSRGISRNATIVMTTPSTASTQNWFWTEKMFLSMSWNPTATSPMMQSIRLPAAMTVLRLDGSQLSWRWAFRGTR